MSKRLYYNPPEPNPTMRLASEMRISISSIITSSSTQKEAIDALAKLFGAETRIILDEISNCALNKGDDGYIRSLKYLEEMKRKLKG